MKLDDPLPPDQLRAIGERHFASGPRGGWRDNLAAALSVTVDAVDMWLSGRRVMKGPPVVALGLLLEKMTAEAPKPDPVASLLD